MARFCTTCGAPVDDQAAFCPTCGAKLIDQSQVPAEQADVTTKIDQPGDATSLPTATVAASDPTSPVDDESAAPRRKTVPLSALVAVIVCAVVLCGSALAIMTFHPFGIGAPEVQANTADETDSEKDADKTDADDNEADDTDENADDASAQSDGAKDDSTESEGVEQSSDAEDETPVVQNTIIVQSDPQESRPQQSAPAPQSTSAPNNYFVCPDSGTHLYTDSELYAMSPDDLEIARNEIYARYGRGFNSTSLQGYFDSQAWYTRLYSPEEFDAMESPLNSVEQQNVVNMLRVETDLRN